MLTGGHMRQGGTLFSFLTGGHMRSGTLFSRGGHMRLGTLQHKLQAPFSHLLPRCSFAERHSGTNFLRSLIEDNIGAHRYVFEGEVGPCQRRQ